MQTIIIAGGLAQRIRPLTLNTPKSLIKIKGIPFIDYQLKFLKKQNIDEVILCLGYLGEMVSDYVKDGSQYGIKVKYSFDGKKLLGTGGSLFNAKSLLKGKFIVIYGDSFLPINFQLVLKKFFKSSKSSLMVIMKNKDLWDKSNVIFNGRKIIEYSKNSNSDKMKYIDYGLSVLNKKNFLFFCKDMNSTFDLSLYLRSLAVNDDLDHFLTKKRFFEIGSLSGILDFENYIQKNYEL